MKFLTFSLLMVFPALALAEKSVGPATAATMVRQPGVEECLSVIEQGNKGTAWFQEVTLVSLENLESASKSIYTLKGYKLQGDIIMGNWEIEVEGYSAEEGSTYSCKIVKNEK